MTEQLHFHFSFSCTGEGNGNPLQCSCLENLRDGGASWAAIYGVAQSRTRLKRLSSNYNDNISMLTFTFCHTHTHTHTHRVLAIEVSNAAEGSVGLPLLDNERTAVC